MAGLFGVEVPNLSAWRRACTGDLTAALALSRPPDTSVPSLPPTPLGQTSAAEQAVLDSGPGGQPETPAGARGLARARPDQPERLEPGLSPQVRWICSGVPASLAPARDLRIRAAPLDALAGLAAASRPVPPAAASICRRDMGKRDACGSSEVPGTTRT